MKIKKRTIVWRRKQWTANRADPTQVIRWSMQSRWLDIDVTDVTWGISSIVQFRGQLYRGHNRWWAQRLFGWLESRWRKQQLAFDEDPMGRLSDYE